MKLLHGLQVRRLFSHAALFGAIFLGSALANSHAAELIMFEQAGCTWCETFDREIAPIYPKTTEGQRAPLRRVNIDHALPPDLAFIELERLAPLFVLVENGHEIGRIRGYPGDDNFWGLLGVLIKKLDAAGTSGERAMLSEKSLRAIG
ncbi:MAG TPA: transcriptional regulator [Pseudolabrys sp.]